MYSSYSPYLKNIGERIEEIVEDRKEFSEPKSSCSTQNIATVA